jgi:L-malate glycosyltransferase
MTRLCFIGSMLGRHPGQVAIMGEILAGLFEQSGYKVIAVSRRQNRVARLADIAATLVLRRRTIELQCLQVYGGLSFVGEDVASWLGRLLGHRIIMHVHGGAMPEFMAGHPRWACRVLRRADAIVCPSPFLARALAKYKFEARIIPNVVDQRIYPFRHRRRLRPRLLWMRSFHPVYNPEMAVRVLKHVKKQIPDATLVIAGQDKGMESKVRELADELQVRESVEFPGYLDVPQKIREGRAADIFLNTTRVDNTPVSIIEACAMGIPVVATDVGGISDLLTNEQTALLVRDDDDRGMAAAVLRLLQDPELASRLSTNGAQLARRSFWDTVRPQWEDLFAEVLRQPQKRPGCALAMKQDSSS